MHWETDVRRGLNSYPIVVMVNLSLSFPRVVWPKWKPLKYPLTDERMKKICGGWGRGRGSYNGILLGHKKE